MMNKRMIVLSLALSLTIGLLLVGVVAAQTGGGYDLTWWTVDGGGGTVAGGGYTLTGTAGQPEPGPALSGGGYTLTNGFWPGEGEAPSPCEKLNGVAISGATSGPPGDYTFTAVTSPANAATPITFVWDNGDTTAWSTRSLTAGTHNLSITATNCNGTGQVTDDHTIVISDPLPGCSVALTSVAISGPATGQTGTSYTFSASVSPANADTPIAYTWSPPPNSGQGTTSASYTWVTAGTKTVSVTASNCGGAGSDINTITISASSGVHKIYLPLVRR